MSTAASTDRIITTAALLAHWQGHRRLTRRVIEAFPAEAFASWSIGGMRPFASIAMELLAMGAPMVKGLVTGKWTQEWDREALPQAEVLKRWDESTGEIDELWKQLGADRFHERVTAFGLYEGVVYDLLLYVIDNEIHHRGQGYVYLRALGVEPPPFYERS